MRERVPHDYPGVLKKALVSFAYQRALWRSVACLLRGLLLAGGILVAVCAFDRFVDVSGVWRLPATLAFAVILAGTLALILFYFVRSENYDEVARTLDESGSDRRGSLRSILDFTRRGIHRHFLAEISQAQAVSLWQDRQAGQFISRKHLLKPAAGLVVLALLIASAFQVESIRAELLLKRFLAPLGNHMRPTATWIEVDAAPELNVNGSDPVTIRARVKGRPVAEPTLLARLNKAGGGKTIQKLQPEPDGRFELTLKDVRESFDYTVTLGKARTAVYRVQVTPRPTIAHVTVEYDYPKYTGLKKKTETLSGRTITALEGTKIKLDVTCNVPLQKASAVMGEGSSSFVISPKDQQTAFLRLFVSRNDRLDVQLEGRNGLASLEEAPFNIRVLVDSPPAVIITSKLDERAYYENEVVEIGYRAQDDIGLTEIGLQAGRNEQPADLAEYGTRQTQGTIKIPVSTLAPGGESTVKLKVVARDGKGQAGASRELTLRVAVNSYDRQLRRARNAITGQTAFNNEDILGLPQLRRHEERLQSLRGFSGTAAILREMLGDQEKPGAAHERQTGALRYTAHLLASGFDHITVGLGRAYIWLTAAYMQPRLKDLVAMAVCDSEVSLPPDLLAPALAKALSEPNAKAALAPLEVVAAGATQVQAQVVAQLQLANQIVQTELAGYLAEGLVVSLARASADSLADPEFVASEQARLKELVGVLEQGVGTNLLDTLQAALTNKETAAGLSQALPLLRDLSTQLVVQAASLAETNAAPVPFSNWHIAPGAGGDRKRIDILGLKLIAMTRQERADSVVLLRDTLTWLGLYTGSGAPAVGASPAQEQGWRLYAVLSQARGDAEALRVGVMAGFMAPGDPEFEFYWLRLRESVLAMRKLAKSPDLLADAKARLLPLVESLKPALHWTPQEGDPVRLAVILRTWETEFNSRIPGARPAAQDWLKRADQAVVNALPLLQAGIGVLRQDVKGVIGSDSYIGSVMPMYARLQALQATSTAIANAAEWARLHQVGGKDLERIVLAQILLTRASNHFMELILKDMDIMPIKANVQGMTGKRRQYEALDRFLSEAELAIKGTDDATRTRILHDNLIGPAWDQEIGFIGSAVRLAGALANLKESLSAIAADRVSSAALWGEVWCRSRQVLDEIEAGHAPSALALAQQVRKTLELLPSLPRDVQTLPEILAAVEQAPAERQPGSRSTRDLAGVLAEMRALTKPASQGGRNVFPRDVLAVSRARVASAFQPAASQAALEWTLSEMENNRRLRTIQQPRLSFGGMGALSEDEFANLKLPRHLYLELKRAREQAMPELFKDRCYRYLNGILEAAR
jgi:hypothetical protein